MPPAMGRTEFASVERVCVFLWKVSLQLSWHLCCLLSPASLPVTSKGACDVAFSLALGPSTRCWIWNRDAREHLALALAHLGLVSGPIRYLHCLLVLSNRPY